MKSQETAPESAYERPSVEAQEIAFFSHYYTEQAYNPLGWRLRLERELASLLRAAGTRRLGRVLSIGCGAGEFELMLADVADDVTGLDLSPEAIQIANRAASAAHAHNVRFLCQSAAQLPTGERFDVIVCLAFLHHVPEASLPGFLREAWALLRPGGLFYSEDPNRRGILRSVGRFVLGAQYDRFHTADERELDPFDTERSLAAAGFVHTRIHYIDVSLIPATFLLAHRPGWPLYACRLVDWIWCRTALAQWASGFALCAQKPD